METLNEFLEQLCDLSGASGNEIGVRYWISQLVKPYADSMRVDALGNLIVEKKGRVSASGHLMIAAHMDEVGLMVSSITEEGYLKFVTLGGIDRRILLGKRVLIGDNKVLGVIGSKAFHLLSAEERKSIPKLNNLFIDIGVSSKAEAEALVSRGDIVVFNTRSAPIGKDKLRAKAVDDRVGCALMVKLLQEDLPLDVTFVFTVQEEVGTRGAFGAAFSVQPKLALVLEGTTAADLPENTGAKRVCALGEGAVVPFMDGGTIYDRALFEQLRHLAQRHNIPWQTKHRIAGGTDASAIQKSRAGVRVIGISAPVRYLHTTQSLVSLADVESMYRLTRAFLQETAKTIEQEKQA